VDGWRERLGAIARGRRVAVVGVGNPLCGDDGVGPLVAARLAARGVAGALDAGPVPENHLGPLLALAPEVVLFVDAVEHGAPAGAVRLVRAADLGPRLSSTHAPSLRLLAALLGAAGAAAWVVGPQPARTAFGAPMTVAVAAAARALEDALAAALAASAAAPGAARTTASAAARRPGPAAAAAAPDAAPGAPRA